MQKKSSVTLQHNKELASLFSRMADCYRYLGKEERFRALAYERASKTFANLQEPVDVYDGDIKKLDKLKGVGESIAAKIIEYLQTGRIKTFEKLKDQVPVHLLELMEIEGFGPATIKLLHDKLHIRSKEDLLKALEKGSLDGLRGFGARKIENMKRVLKLGPGKIRLPLKEAERIGRNILNEFKKIPGVHKVTLAGSLRRKKETVGDIDIVITAPPALWKKIINAITRLPLVDRVLASGKTKASIVLKNNYVQVDVRIVHDEEYGAALFYFTGSKEHNIQLRTIAKSKGWKVNEYGVFDERTGKKLAGKTEEGIYELFGLKYIPPEKRLGRNELDQV